MTTTTFRRENSRVVPAKFEGGMMGRFKAYLARTRAERQLHELDDRMLSDIGVRRSEIEKMVWGN